MNFKFSTLNIIILLVSIFFLNSNNILAQAQVCPANFNFSFGSLTNWQAYTGNNKNGNGPNAIFTIYNSSNPTPTGTLGAITIPEESITASGIKVNTSNTSDVFGGFPTIPTINGYQYNYSVTLGSTNITHGSSGGTGGGYIRGLTYLINVPTSAIIQPYTITYAYAMVLENGSHPTNQQPLFTATLTTSAGVIDCASPKYNLPTTGVVDANGNGAVLDDAAAAAQGFTLSNVNSPNNNGNSNESQHRVYTKDWREVTLDLSPYRGQTVQLTFEADNCVPGGHFSYAYIALRNVCAGLQITGNLNVCANSTQTYSIPALAGATYNWVVPNGWTILSGAQSDIISVKTSNGNGQIIAHEVNSCADLYDTVQVAAANSGSPGAINGGTNVCIGTNAQTLTLSGNTGSILSWMSTTNNGVSWQTIANTSNTYTVNNLSTTTLFRALVQSSNICPADTSVAATIVVNAKTLGGIINPPNTNICANQTANSVLTLLGNVGAVTNWQSSLDGINWTNFNPLKTDSNYLVNGTITTNLLYRILLKNGACPADTSALASITQIITPFPKTSFNPADTTICFGYNSPLSAQISVGTNYKWLNNQPLTGTLSGTISSNPFTTTVIAKPISSTYYVLSVINSGCPNELLDTFKVHVLPKLNVFAGNDTSIVLGQPLTFQSSADSTATSFLWSPSNGLSATNILQPTANITEAMLNGVYYYPYLLKATNILGCSATDTIIVRIFKTAPSIFIPNAFTPNNDGLNDVISPILAGIQKLDYFKVYNRYGQLVYQTQKPGDGWDGKFKGVTQDTDTFVYIAQAIDYTGATIKQKGTFILIR